MSRLGIDYNKRPNIKEISEQDWENTPIACKRVIWTLLYQKALASDETFSEVLHKIRRRLKLNQKQFAYKIDRSVSVVNRWFAGSDLYNRKSNRHKHIPTVQTEVDNIIELAECNEEEAYLLQRSWAREMITIRK